MLYDMESALKETLQDGSLSRRVEEMSRKGIAASSALLPLGGLGAGIIAKAIWERKNIRKGDDIENTLTNKIIRKAPIAGFATGVVASPFYRHIAKSMIKRGSLNRDVSLRPHQVDAIKFLQERGRGVVAHGTGLGKTLTSIAAFENMREKGDANKAIVVVPAALRENYAKNISDFTDSDYSIYGAKGESGTSYYDQPSDAPYNIMSYEMYKKDPEGIRERLGADTLIIDEAHRARNDTSVTYKDLSANTDKYKHIIALTGSLVNNEPSDIAPLLHVAFGDEDAAIADRKMFDKLFVRKDVKVKGWFNPVTEVTPSIINKQNLAKHLSDKVHYVSHEAMKDSLPEKEEEVVKVQMTPEQKRLYLWSLNALDPITRLKIKNNIPVSQREMTGIFAQMMQGRKLMTDQSVMDDSLIDKNPYEYSPKIKKIVDDLGEHLEESDDNKAVVYGNLIHHQLNAVQKGLEYKGIPYTTYYGVGNEGNSSKARSGNVKEYMDGKKRVLLISGAGGEGLDLKGSTMLQMVEGHYNPEKIQQAEARVRRMGDMRGKPIKVKRYVSTLPPSLLEKGLSLFGRKPSTSIDEYIYNVAERKNKLNAEFRDVLSKRANIIGWTVGHSVSDLINRAIDKRESAGIDASIKQRLINEQASEYLLPKHYNAIKRKSGADERQKLIEAGSWLLSAGVAPYTASLLQRIPVMERMVAKTNSPGIPIALTALTTLGLGLATTQGPKRLLRARLMRSDDVPRAIEQHTKDLNRKAERKIIAAEKYIDQAERIERLGLEKRMLEL